MPTVATRLGSVVALEGPSGSGKSAVGRELSRLLGGALVLEAYERVGTGPSMTFQNRAELHEIERLLLREEGERWTETELRRPKERFIVLDTSTMGPLTYSWGLREGFDPQLDVVGDLVRYTRQLLADRKWGIPDLTLYLDVPESVTESRAARDPQGHPERFRERHRRVARYERLLYEREFPRRLPGRFVTISGDGPISEIARVIQERLERYGPVPPAAPTESERLLELFEGSGPSHGRSRSDRVSPASSPAGPPNL
jgi:thymidylate kinase